MSLYMEKWSTYSSLAPEPSVIGLQHGYNNHMSSLKEV